MESSTLMVVAMRQIKAKAPGASQFRCTMVQLAEATMDLAVPAVMVPHLAPQCSLGKGSLAMKWRESPTSSIMLAAVEDRAELMKFKEAEVGAPSPSTPAR
mmetsp:Transcript_105252/g.181503  ORF Transcript_105252/g.181503 Transcript_105252/m.181503 type:complete len:101 (+) Transcript_105252:309-611(+)